MGEPGDRPEKGSLMMRAEYDVLVAGAGASGLCAAAAAAREGAEVLDYMTSHCGLTRRDYARGWGHLWANYRRQYDYIPEVQKAVRKRIACKHPEIYAYYLIYSAKQLLTKN